MILRRALGRIYGFPLPFEAHFHPVKLNFAQIVLRALLRIYSQTFSVESCPSLPAFMPLHIWNMNSKPITLKMFFVSLILCVISFLDIIISAFNNTTKLFPWYVHLYLDIWRVGWVRQLSLDWLSSWVSLFMTFKTHQPWRLKTHVDEPT